MKIIKLVFIALMAMLMLAGCSKAKEENTPDNTTVEPVATPEEICGIYTDEVAGRVLVEVETDRISISWSSSYNEIELFELSTDYDAGNNRINYSNGVLTKRVYTDETNYTDTVVYSDGTGFFEIGNDRLTWQDYKENRVTALAKMDNTQFTLCDSLQKAVEISGLSFDEPSDDSYPMTVSQKSYYATQGCVLITCTGEEKIVNVCKADNPDIVSKLIVSDGLANNWKESLKGLEVDCFGNEDMIQVAKFNNGTMYYGISYSDANTETANPGLTIDQVQSMIMSMQ